MKTIQDLEVFDTIWVEKNGEINKGWVYDINKKHIIVTIPIFYGNYPDYRFIITRPLTQTELKQDDLVLYLNEPCI